MTSASSLSPSASNSSSTPRLWTCSTKDESVVRIWASFNASAACSAPVRPSPLVASWSGCVSMLAQPAQHSHRFLVVILLRLFLVQFFQVYQCCVRPRQYLLLRCHDRILLPVCGC